MRFSKFLFLPALWVLSAFPSPVQALTLTIRTDSPGKPISPMLFGIFFEDLNYAADGGLYAELVQNRSFEYSALDRPDWNALTGWQLLKRAEGDGTAYIGDARPLGPNNPRYLELHCRAGREGSAVGLSNSGFGGIVLKAGEGYTFSVFARQQPGRHFSWQVCLESRDGTILDSRDLPPLSSDWKPYSAVLHPKESTDSGRIVLWIHGDGVIYLDMVSLFPQNTFKNRKNGLRRDLAEVIADLKPRFVRFPGGCLVHGDGLSNLYRWKDTIGPVEHRKAQKNIWRYHQTVGLGYFEYFQFCEDIGAEPVPVMAAGVSCQNTDRYWGVGQQAVPLEKMPEYIQEVLDLIEWANGAPDSTWGRLRAQAGHPEPFNLKYLGIGNEDAMTPAFRERFEMLYRAVKAKYPDITVIGTVGPAPEGFDFEEGWKFADALRLEMVDEHGYKSPQWFWSNLNRYDRYDRTKSKVYLGEYAAHEPDRRNTLRSALAEAAYMIALERNGDLVRMASYAPLLGKHGNTQWNPNLIYFTNTEVLRTANYYVQMLFGTHAGDRYLPANLDPPLSDEKKFAFSAVRDSRNGDIIVKMVNGDAQAVTLTLNLQGLPQAETPAIQTLLTADTPDACNTFRSPNDIVPKTAPITLRDEQTFTAAPYSLTVLRIPRQK
ncbi:MAG: alpha-L-arabinofuranosidase C-terminal domain-containing protein [Anaerohalosphaeraceae bacterium]